MKQTNLFDMADSVDTRPLPENLPRPINDWALSLYILVNHPKGVTVFDAMKNYGMVKFQERLNEILSEHPTLVAKKMIKVRKRLNREVSVMQYRIVELEAAIDLYMKELNKKGGSKCLKTDKK